VGHEHILPADASIATNWPTAYRVAEHSASLFKFYFVQAFEPEFYETSDPFYPQAERTYSLPLHHVCIGRYLGNRIRGLTGKPTDVIDFAVDQDTFHMSVRPEDRPNPITVLFFARPSLKGRGYELGVKALRILKEQCPNVEVLFFGAKPEDLGEIPFDFHNLGVVSADELCKILNRAHILLSFSLSNISWVPYEGMACGCAVVEAKVPSVVEMVSPGRNCLLADPEPEAVAAALQCLVADTTLRCQLANQAAEELRHRTWQHSTDQFEEILRHRCFVRLER
jgi:glycosyltransferase involved in cell wall biosynthesis